MIPLFLFGFVALCLLAMLLGWMDERNIKTILLCLVSGSTFAQLEPTLLPEKDWFELECDFYITTQGSDSTYYQNASMYMDEYTFYIIRGQDTTVRKLCRFGPYYSELLFNCGDYVKPIRDANGRVYALWYREGKMMYYFNEKFIRRNLPPKE